MAPELPLQAPPISPRIYDITMVPPRIHLRPAGSSCEPNFLESTAPNNSQRQPQGLHGSHAGRRAASPCRENYLRREASRPEGRLRWGGCGIPEMQTKFVKANGL